MADAPGPFAPLIRAGAELHQRGWVPATAGNLSVRSESGGAWVTASGRRKGGLKPEDFVEVDLDGAVRSAPGGGRPSAETSLHLAVYRTRPEAGAVLHVHTVPSALVTRWAPASTGSGPVLLELPSLEILKAFGLWQEHPQASVAVFDNWLEVPRIAEAVQAFLQEPPTVRGFLIRDHGLTAWGPDVDAALTAVEAFEFVFDYMVASRR